MAKYNAFTDFTPMPFPSPSTNIMKAMRYGQWWVLKGLQPEYNNDERYVNTLIKEYEIGSQFHNSSIVSFFGLEEVPEMGGMCIVEEYVEGITLKKFLKTTKPSLEMKIKLLSEIINALSYISSMQVVHRDIKPSNIMVTNNGQNVKIVDFGLSLADTHAILRAPAGSRKYMAPEQMVKGVAVDTRADIFSLGKVMAEFNLPSRFSHILRKCTEHNREKRYSSFQQLSVDFNKAVYLQQTMKKTIPWLFFFAVVVFVSFFVGFGDLGGRIFGYAGAKVALAETPAIYYNDTTHYENNFNRYYSIFLPHYNCNTFFLKGSRNDVPGNIPESKAVDLGLSVDWAPFNLGCDHETLIMSGVLVSYGDTTGHYCGNDPNELYDNNITDAQHDIVTQKWGGRWRMPTIKEYEELFSKCQFRFITSSGYQPYYVVTGPNGNSIAITGSGYRIGMQHRGALLDGLYWTNQVSDTRKGFAKAVVVSRDNVRIYDVPVTNGLLIRPVLDKSKKKKKKPTSVTTKI